jgi:hypothetical protein
MDGPVGRLERPNKSKEEDIFKLNVREREIKYPNDSLYSECPSEDEDWRSDNIVASIKKWKKSFYRNEDLNWFQDSELEPLDLKDPRIKVRCHKRLGIDLIV